MAVSKSADKKPTKKQVQQVAGYMRAIADAFKAYLVKKLSVPVSIIRRRSPKTGKWGTHVVRSNPGEYPRAETGSLANTVSYTVTPRGNNVSVSIGWLGDRTQKRFMSRTKPYPVGHPNAPRGGRKFKLTKSGRATAKSPKTPDYYSFILEYRMQRKLLQKAWKDFVTSGMLRRAVGAAGFEYVPGLGTSHIINFGPGMVQQSFKNWAEAKSATDMINGRKFVLHSREDWMNWVERDKRFGAGYRGRPPRSEEY